MANPIGGEIFSGYPARTLAFVRVPPPALATVGFFAAQQIPVSGLPRRPHLYAPIAQPPQVVAAAETITVDKWFRVLERPRDVARLQYTYSSWTAGKLFEEITVDKWFTVVQLPRLDVTRRQDLFAVLAFTPQQPVETITVDKWWRLTEQPRQDAIRRQDLYSSLAWTLLQIAETITVDKWWTLTERPRMDVRALQYLYLAWTISPAALTAVVTSVDRWFNQTSTPNRAAGTTQYRSASSTAMDAKLIPAPPVVTVDQWFNQTSMPVRDVSRTQATFSFSVLNPFPLPFVPPPAGVVEEERIELGTFFGITVPDIDLGIA